MNEKEARDVITAYDREHPPEDAYDGRMREREAEAHALKAQEARREVGRQRRTNNTTAWCGWVDQRVGEHIKVFRNVLVVTCVICVIAADRQKRWVAIRWQILLSFSR